MKFIELTQDKFAIVDDDDYEYINQFYWHYYIGNNKNTGYAKKGLNGKSIRMHRLIMKVDNRNVIIDHINRNGLDNRKCNLRISTYSQNRANSANSKKSTSIYKGVHWHKAHKKWACSIRKDKKLYHLGYFKIEKDAANEYNKKALQFFGEFANINIIN